MQRQESLQKKWAVASFGKILGERVDQFIKEYNEAEYPYDVDDLVIGGLLLISPVTAIVNFVIGGIHKGYNFIESLSSQSEIQDDGYISDASSKTIGDQDHLD